MADDEGPGGRPRRTDVRVERTCRAVLDEASRLMVEEGLAAVTFDGLSRRTGISRTTLYRHWPRPVDLVIETFERLTEPEPVPVTDDLAADLRTIYRAARDGLERGVWRRLVPSLIAAADADPDLEELHARFIAERRRPVLERLRTAVEAGDLPAGADLDLAVDLMTAPLFYRRLLRHAHTSDALVEEVVDVVLDRLRRPPAPGAARSR